MLLHSSRSDTHVQIVAGLRGSSLRFPLYVSLSTFPSLRFPLYVSLSTFVAKQQSLRYPGKQIEAINTQLRGVDTGCQASKTAFRSHCARPTGRYIRLVCERGVLSEFRAARTCASYWLDKTINGRRTSRN